MKLGLLFILNMKGYVYFMFRRDKGKVMKLGKNVGYPPGGMYCVTMHHLLCHQREMYQRWFPTLMSGDPDLLLFNEIETSCFPSMWGPLCN